MGKTNQIVAVTKAWLWELYDQLLGMEQHYVAAQDASNDSDRDAEMNEAKHCLELLRRKVRTAAMPNGADQEQQYSKSVAKMQKLYNEAYIHLDTTMRNLPNNRTTTDEYYATVNQALDKLYDLMMAVWDVMSA